MRNFLLGLILLTSLAGRPSHAVNAALSGTLSIVPGLGQVTNGNGLEGLGWFVTTAGLFFSGNPTLGQVGYDLWQYNMYDAYRDARPSGGMVKNHSVFQNYFAVFNPLNIIDPIAAPAIAYAAIRPGTFPNTSGIPKNLALRAPVYGFVGLGEEALFRGFLYPAFSGMFSSKVVGALTSSVAFAFFHFTNGASDLTPTMLTARTVMGLVFCIQTTYNKFDLRKSIFTHAWWDFFVTRNGGYYAQIGLKYPISW